MIGVAMAMDRLETWTQSALKHEDKKKVLYVPNSAAFLELRAAILARGAKLAAEYAIKGKLVGFHFYVAEDDPALKQAAKLYGPA